MDLSAWNTQKLIWNKETTPEELYLPLTALAEEYPVREGKNATVQFRKCADPKTLSVQKDSTGFTITYGQFRGAMRGLGFALAGIEQEESLDFTAFGLFLDCSQTGVMTPAELRRWFRRAALFGYNQAILSVKDTYVLPEEPYFGYMCGAYTMEELQSIDQYARFLGIEMIAGIQTLGAMESLLRWPAYAKVRDTDDTLLADSPDTETLIEKMIAFWSRAFPSRRIHLGMELPRKLGRGRYSDLHGWEQPSQIYLRHLKKVSGICEHYGMKPMIWYDGETSGLPENIQLVSRDCYHRNKADYAEKLKNQNVIMASGIWTGARLWYDHEQTVATVAPCLDACCETGCKEIFFTLWGDDGGYCEFESAFAGLAWCAAKANGSSTEPEDLAPLFQAVCHADYRMQLLASKMERMVASKDSAVLKISAAAVLWDDPLMGMIWREYLHYSPSVWTDTLKDWKALRAELEPAREDNEAGRINHAWNLIDVLVKKVNLRLTLLKAYSRRDLPTLERISEDYLPDLIDAIDGLNESFRSLWQRSYKPYGLEVIQIRLAGLAERCRETGRRIESLLDGECDRIEELEQIPETLGLPDIRYRMIATAGPSL